MKKSIELFMWGYQPHFRRSFEYSMNEVMEELGVSEAGAECLLVGARRPCRQNPSGVCVEPEDGKWPVDLFDALLDLIDTEVARHPRRNMFYTHEPSMRDKSEDIRRDSVRTAVQKKLGAYDLDQGVCSFVGSAVPVNDYHVVPVLQLPKELFECFPPLREPVSDDRFFTGHASLIHAAVSEVLNEAHDELLRPDPGRYLDERSRSSGEIVRRAATSFMRTFGLAIADSIYGVNRNLFERFNLISSLMYEGAKGTGRLLLAKPDDGSVDMFLKFVKPVPFREHRWSRKVLQMASPNIALVADYEKIFGLGELVTGIDPWESQKIFEIQFLDHYHWQLSCGDKVMLVSKNGVPSLPQEKFSHTQLLDIYHRLFPEAGEEDGSHFVNLFEAAVGQDHGNMLIVAKDAESEAERLSRQGARIEPKKLTPDLYSQVSAIDGAVIIDPQGVCHAIGVVLDGKARKECTPSRGSRYNSGIRYVGSADSPRLAVIVSDDRTVDIIPVLRPRIKRSEIDKAVVELEAANRDNYYPSINWLNSHRFYLSQEQCDRINIALKRIQSEPIEIGEIQMPWNKFLPNPDFDESYLESEDTEPSS